MRKYLLLIILCFLCNSLLVTAWGPDWDYWANADWSDPATAILGVKQDAPIGSPNAPAPISKYYYESDGTVYRRDKYVAPKNGFDMYKVTVYKPGEKDPTETSKSAQFFTLKSVQEIKPNSQITIEGKKFTVTEVKGDDIFFMDGNEKKSIQGEAFLKTAKVAGTSAATNVNSATKTETEKARTTAKKTKLTTTTAPSSETKKVEKTDERVVPVPHKPVPKEKYKIDGEVMIVFSCGTNDCILKKDINDKNEKGKTVSIKKLVEAGVIKEAPVNTETRKTEEQKTGEETTTESPPKKKEPKYIDTVMAPIKENTPSQIASALLGEELNKRQELADVKTKLESLDESDKEETKKLTKEMRKLEREISQLQKQRSAQYVALDRQLAKDAVTIDEVKDAKDQFYLEQISLIDKELNTLQGQLTPEQEKRKAELENEKAILEHKRVTQVKKSLTFMQRVGEFIKAYHEYSGLGQFSALFIDDDELQEKQKEAEDRFCDAIYLGGTKCWSSIICKKNLEPSAGSGTLVVNDYSGMPRGVVHIEAERSLPAVQYGLNFTAERLYKITYSIRNPFHENLHYNLIFLGNGTYSNAFETDKIVPAGNVSAQFRSSAIAKYSTKLYDQICITLNPALRGVDGELKNQVCNYIITTKMETMDLTNSEQATANNEVQEGQGDFADF